MHRLSARELRRSRPYLVVVKTLWTLIALAVGIWAFDTLTSMDYQRPALWSAGYLKWAIQLAVLVGVIGVWYVPRTTLATALVASLLGAVTAPEHAGAWWPAALAAGVALAFIVVRDKRSRPRGEVVLPQTDVEWARSYAAPSPDRRLIGWAVIGALAVAGMVGLVIHQVQVAEVAAFERDAVLAQGTYLRAGDDGTVFVSVDGVEHEFDDPWFDDEIPAGQDVDVLVAPDGEMALAGAGQRNPAWLLGLAGALPMGAAVAWSWLVAPAIRRRRLVEQGGPGVTVRVLCDGETALVLPVDSDWPALELVDLAGHVDGDKVAEGVEDFDEDAEPEPEEELDPEVPSEPATLAAWADEMNAWGDDDPGLPEEDKVLAEAVIGPDTNGAEPFILVGGWASGSTVALARATGQVWLAEVSEPKVFKGRRRFARSARRGLSGWDLEAGPTTATERLLAWAMRNARWTRWVAALGSALLVGSLVILMWSDGGAEDWLDGIFLVLRTLAVASVPLFAIQWAVDGTGRARSGIGTYGFFLDDVLARDRVEFVAAGESAVAVRMRAPDDAIALHPDVIRSGATANEAAAELRHWLDDAPRRARSGRRPSPGLVATALMPAAWAVAFLVSTLT